MTERKDFKRIVRARARRTGETYSSALRKVRNARPDQAAAGGRSGAHEKGPAMAITRTVPDVRSTNLEKTTRFYTELLGFHTRVEQGTVVSFVSPTHDQVEVTLNRDGFALPPGFTVEVDTTHTALALFQRGREAHLRIIEELAADGTRFSLLDPSGRRVTVSVAGTVAAPPGNGDASRSITRAIAGVSTNDMEATRRFYVDYLGFDVVSENDGITMFRSPTSPWAQVIASTRVANPDGFDLVVGSLDRLDHIYREAQGRWVVLHEPADFPDHGIRCFMLLDPNGIGVNVAALLDAERHG